MLTVWYSNRAERLVEALAVQLKTSRPGLFERVPVVVPHANLGRWLRFELSRRLGVAGRLAFQPWVDFFEGLAGDGPVRPLTPLMLRSLLHRLLTTLDQHPGPESKILRGYVEASAAAPDQVERRAFALAGQLASLFLHYRAHRAPMLEAWRGGRTLEAEPWRTLEQWQRFVYLSVFGDHGALAEFGQQRGQRIVLLADLLDHLAPVDLNAPATVHVFAAGPMPPVFYALIARLAALRDVHVYALNPCALFWEEMRTGSVDEVEVFSSEAVTGGHMGSEAPSDFWAPTQENPLLRAWGRPGRDEVWALNRLTGHGARELFVEPARLTTTLLRALQQDILYAVPAEEQRERLEADGTVVLLDCPGIQREAEEVTNAIWSLMQSHAGSGLRLNEIAVLVNDAQRQAYVAHLAAAFDANRRLPMNVIDADALAPSRLLDAIVLLLELPFGTFRRQELLRLMVHPNVVGRFSDVDPALWLSWCEGLSIIHGADRDDHAGTYIDQDVFNWDQGLRRLVLGAFMADDDDALVFEAGPDRRYLPETIEPSQLTAAARFTLLARSLIADARWLRDHRAPLAAWAAILSKLVDTYLVTTEDDNPDHLLAYRKALACLAEADLGEHDLAYRTAFHFARAALAEVELHDGLYSGDGVVVGGLSSARGLPFRAVFVMGLTEGRFPGSDSADPLDLRSVSWQRGDVALRDRDRYDFLGAVVSARDWLTVSWTSTDATTGDDLEPSGVILDLRRAIEAFGVPALSQGACTIVHRPHRFDPVYFGGGDPRSALPPSHHRGALAEAQMLALRTSLAASLGHDHADALDLRHLRHDTPEAVRAALATQLRPWQTPPAVPAPRPTRVALTLRRLADFLEDPLQATAALHLTASADAYTDVLDVEHEPFESDRLVDSHLLRRVVRRALSTRLDDDATHDLYDALALRLVMRGELPVGVFQDAARTRHLGVVARWRQNLAKFDIAPTDRMLTFAYGREETDGAEAAPPITLRIVGADGEPVQIELFGLTEGWVESRDAVVSFINRESPMPRDFLRAFVTHVVLTSTGAVAAEEGRRLVISSTRAHTSRTKADPFVLRLPPLGQAEAETWLQGLLEDLLSGAHDVLLPLDAIDAWIRAGLQGPFEEHLREWLHRYGPRSFQAVHDLRPYGPPADVEALVHRRFGPLYFGVDSGGRP